MNNSIRFPQSLHTLCLSSANLLVFEILIDMYALDFQLSFLHFHSAYVLPGCLLACQPASLVI